MLSKKFFSDGETPGPAATSGITMDAIKTAAVRPVTAFSFNEACTSSLDLGLGFGRPTLFPGLFGVEIFRGCYFAFLS
ncbi:hypothetical protein L484_018581 [Morus notabilis]|uniref:Uncharacterized protein n=1 Tax=Morus notabilis TaxID=981085 RepID=W9R6W3_9ROSA|nr:hypothetical protein L484_018581 [Morus notabilis]